MKLTILTFLCLFFFGCQSPRAPYQNTDRLCIAIGEYQIAEIKFNKYGGAKYPPDYILLDTYENNISTLSKRDKIKFLTAVWLITYGMDAGRTSIFITIIKREKLDNSLLKYWEEITNSPSGNYNFKNKMIKGVQFLKNLPTVSQP